MPDEKYRVSAPHSHSVEQLADELNTSAGAGLSKREAGKRFDSVGSNELREHQSPSPLTILLRQFSGVIIWVLLAALTIALILGRWPEAMAIAGVIVVNTAIGFFSEWRAIRTINALRRKEDAHAVVIRDGEPARIFVRELVPGDLVEINAGDLVPADGRIVESDGIRLNEAALTGESDTVSKGAETLDEEVPLAERHNMLYKGSSVVGGRGKILVTGTGMQTEIGRIARAAMEAESTEVPLRERLDKLGRGFVWLVVVSVVFVGLAGWWRGRDPIEVVETAVALGIAAVPESLPIVATIALAHGMWVMGKHNAVVKQLQAVQALGSVPYLFVDKTGTLTRNHMRLVRVATPQEDFDCDEDGSPGDAVRRVLEVGVLCNGADLSSEDDKGGDPMELALLEAGRDHGLQRGDLLGEQEELRVEEFDRESMMMATFHRDEDADSVKVSVKGAPGRVLEACTKMHEEKEDSEFGEDEQLQWNERAEKLAGKGFRVLAAAVKMVDSEKAEPYENLTFLGLFALEDPLRENVSESIGECEASGIRVIMVTGDKPETAESIARQAGIGGGDDPLHVLTGKELRDPDSHADQSRVLEADVIARVEPQQKMDLVELAQAEGTTAGMTGDGVNDAPALKRANIGIAMGERGSEAAKEVADIVLRDDALGTIVEAVRRGRTIMDNIRKSAMFLLCTNLAEIIAVTIGAAMAYPLPLLALQILYLNVITDVFPALALSVGPSDQNVMQRRSLKENRAILARSHWLAVLLLGMVLAGTTLGALVLAKEWLGLSDTAATTVSFITLGLSKVWFPFNLRDPASPAFVNEITRNRWVWGSVVLCISLLALAVYFPPLGSLLKTAPPGLPALALVLALSLLPLALSQVALVVLKRVRLPVE